MKRRSFIKNASLTGVGITVGSSIASVVKGSIPLPIAIWNVKYPFLVLAYLLCLIVNLT